MVNLFPYHQSTFISFDGFSKYQGKSKRLINFEDMKIQVVDEEDSRLAIVRAARHLCQRDEDFDQDDITQFLRSNH